MKLVEIKNVRCEATDEVGTIYLVGSVDKDAYDLECIKHYGLSIFFRPEDESTASYVKSFVLTKNEKSLLKRGSATTIRDIGYILDVQNCRLDLIQLLGVSQPTTEPGFWNREKILRSTFTLEHNDEGMARLNEEYNKHSYNKAGFRKALSSALMAKEMLNITEDSILPTRLLGEVTCMTYDYMVDEVED